MTQADLLPHGGPDVVTAAERLPRHVWSQYNGLVAAIASYDGWVFAGSLRRGDPRPGDIDLVILEGSDADDAFHWWMRRESITPEENTYGADEAATSREDDDRQRQYRIGKLSGPHVDVVVVGREAWGAALLFLTGSRAFNKPLVAQLRAKGWKWTGLGLRQPGGRLLETHTEEDALWAICDAIGVPRAALPAPHDRTAGEWALSPDRALWVST